MFNDELKSQVEEVINKNLPALAAKEVVERLQRIDALEKQNADLLLQKTTSEKHMAEINAKLNKYADIEGREKTLVYSEAKLKDDIKEFEFEKKISALKIDHLQQQKNDIFMLSNTFFSGPMKMTSIMKSSSSSQNDYGQNKNSNGNENTTITEK